MSQHDLSPYLASEHWHACHARKQGSVSFLLIRVHSGIKHCWRYEAECQSGTFLDNVRKYLKLDVASLKEMEQLLLSKQVDRDDATVLCCRKRDAAKISLDRLKAIRGPDVCLNLLLWTSMVL